MVIFLALCEALVAGRAYGDKYGESRGVIPFGANANNLIDMHIC